MLLHIQEYRVSEEKLFISSALDGCHWPFAQSKVLAACEKALGNY
jgi:hypothetical protein